MKTKTIFVCNNCGSESPKWQGKCSDCGAWNSFVEQIAAPTSKTKTEYKKVSAVKLHEIEAKGEHRYKTGFHELDRVLGGGLVKGSLVLLSGDPGIGKSTIILQVCEFMGKEQSILYVSGEESERQIKIRAKRLHVESENLSVLTETNVESVIDCIETTRPDIVMIDSIQTMSMNEISSSPGSVTQVRESTNAFLRTAKSLDIAVIIVGHVNKDGAIAGPKVLEHIVDAVLYFEGERNLSYRILRAVKNRFGSTNEIGVFEMLDTGLCEIENPSKIMLSGRPRNVSGTCVACVIEGTRPIMAEVQGLVSTTGFGNPRRMSTGFDYNRMNLLLAVLEKRAGYFFANLDAYLNVVGGMKLLEPAADLTVAIALISSLKDFVVREDAIAFGEIGLAGEIRAVTGAQARINEAARLGFQRCIVPYHNYKTISDKLKGSIEIIGVRTIRQAVEALS